MRGGVGIGSRLGGHGPFFMRPLFAEEGPQGGAGGSSSGSSGSGKEGAADGAGGEGQELGLGERMAWGRFSRTWRTARARSCESVS